MLTMAAEHKYENPASDELRRRANELENGSRGDPEKMSYVLAYQGRMVAAIYDEMVTRDECERKRTGKWRSPVAIALLLAPLYLTLIGIVIEMIST